MPNVIADTSPIQYLYQANLLDLPKDVIYDFFLGSDLLYFFGYLRPK